MLPFAGSSPRVRGSLDEASADFEGRGIIPAGAGLTVICRIGSLESRDHPRGCGAHWSSFSVLS